MWDKFTPSALNIIKSATKEARLSGHENVDTTHLLFSLVRQRTEGVRAAQVLKDFDLQPEDIYTNLIAIRQAPPSDHKVAFAPEAEAALRSALAEAKREHFTKIGGDQILLGLLHARDTRAAQYLQGKGVTLETAQIKLTELALLEDLDFALSRAREEHTALTRCCTHKLRRAMFQGVKIALAEGAPLLEPAHLLRGALLGDSELVQLLQEIDYPTDQLYRQLESAPRTYFQTGTEPVVLHNSGELITLFQEMEQERLRFGEPQLSTVHLLLAVLAHTQSPLHDQLQALGDINVLNHRRMVERIRARRSNLAE